jgi:hypothetical protein
MRQERIRKPPQRGDQVRIHHPNGYLPGTIETVTTTRAILRTARPTEHPAVRTLERRRFTHVAMISHTQAGKARVTFTALLDRHGDFYNVHGKALWIRPAREVTAV